MAATIHEVLDGLGTWQLDLDWDPELVAELVKGSVLRIYAGERPMYAGVVLTRMPVEKGFVIGGQGADWLLGSGGVGPLIEAREYVAGTDKLANGDFGEGDLYHRFGQDTHWVIAPAGPATVMADSDADDPLDANESVDTDTDDALESDETFDTVPGKQYRLTVVSRRLSGATGRLRGRVVYEGRFKPTTILPNGDLELGPGNGWGAATDLSIVTDAPNARSGTRVIKAVPSTRPQRLTNGNFEAGALSGWTVAVNHLLANKSFIDNDPANARGGNYVLKCGTQRKRAIFGGDMESWTGGVPDGWQDASGALGFAGSVSQDATNRSGNYAARANAGTTALEAISPPENRDVAHSHLTRVNEQERWRLIGFSANDIAAVPATDGHTWVEIHVFKEDFATYDLVETTHLEPIVNFVWRLQQLEFNVSGGFTRFLVRLIASNFHGYWYWDDFSLERVEGNEEILVSSTMVVAAGEDWELTVHARSGPAFLSGAVFPRIRLTGPGKPDLLTELTPFSQTNNQWVASASTVTIPDGYTGAVAELRVRDVEGDWVYVDDCTFVRTRGNVDLLVHDPITIIPLRTYRLKGQIRSGPKAAGDGGISIVATMQSPGRTDVVLESAVQQATADQWLALVMEVTSPSGYDVLDIDVKGVDIVGDNFWVDDITLVDEDDKTFAEDLVIDTGALGTHTHDTTAPAGAQKIHVQLVAESLGVGWEVDEWHLQRIGVTPATISQIVGDLVQDPTDGHELLQLGTVYDPAETIVHDWVIANMHNRDALAHLLSGGVAPVLREYRVNPDLTIDVGTAAELYADLNGQGGRHLVLLTKDDLEVLTPPELAENATEYFSHVKVIGGDRQTANGDVIHIVATSAVPWPTPLLDPGGRPLVRTKIVTDSNVNHPLYAAALASSLASGEVNKEQAVSLRLGDFRARGGFDVGDWIYPYLPDAELEDRTNPLPAADGSAAYPKRIRVLERMLQLGNGFKAEVVPPGGPPIDITDRVRWAPATSADIQVGAFIPSFTLDNEGGAAFKQWQRWRSQFAVA